ncbi:hypothetical protein [Nocardia violaceofusca]|uniref:hypothetical protein n=1 Tax=Nocardia violaceofusca TaxID=941182 RepID=UPI000AD9257E|nr:hypothetical protein [Nocardia violaceofusca]
MTSAQEYEKQYRRDNDKARLDLERFLKEDGRNVFDQPIWTDKPPIINGDINALLDNGAFGLEWFRLALVRYHRVWDIMKLDGFDRIDVPALALEPGLGAEKIDAAGDPDAEMKRLEGKYYDQQRSMNLNSLRDLSTAITGAALGNDSHLGGGDLASDLYGVAQAVPEAWQGRGGAAATDHLAGLHAHADQQAQYLQAVASALNGLPEVLRQIVADKANFVAGFDSPQCPVAGHAMRLGGAEDLVSVMITVAAGKASTPLFGDSDKREAKKQLHLERDDQAKQACKDWLINHFGPAVREAFIAFVHQCALADHYIRQAYKPVMDLLDSQDTTPFPKPPGQQDPNQPSNTGPGPTATGPAAPTTPTSAAPTTPTTPSSFNPATPVSTNPAATQFNPAQILSSLTSQVGQTVQQGITQTLQQGLSQIQNVAQQGLGALGGNLAGLGSQQPGAAAQLTDVKSLTGGKELANLSAFGGNLTVTQAPNGAITAKVTGPDGKPQEYSMGLKDGVPFLKPGPAESTDPSGRGPSEGNGSTPGGGQSAGPGPSGASAAGSSAQSLTPAPAGADKPGSLPSHGVEPRADNPSTGVDAGTNSPSAPGMPMSGMPHAPGGGGKSTPESERPPSGIIPPKPLWTTVPGGDGHIPDGPTGSDVPGPELATVGPLDGGPLQAPGQPGPELATAGPLDSTSPVSDGPSRISGPADSPPRPSPTGVKIEIDTGDAK